MNIKFESKDFDNFIMIYLLDKIENFENLSMEDNEHFWLFIEQLKKKAFFPILNRAFLKTDALIKVQSKRIEDKKEGSDFISLLI